MNEKKLKAYFKLRGLSPCCTDWTVAEFKEYFLNFMRFEGDECGCLRFDRAKSGRRYIIFSPSRCYID